nr:MULTISPECIES: NAD-dependent protein deacetylase [unclassified Janthinobacterium]
MAAACAGELVDLFARYPKVLVLTGAGLSTASGIPDYRDRSGARRGNAPVQGPEFRRDEAVRRRYWARSMAGWPTLAAAAPNAGHRAIAALQADGRLAGLVTQNVDGLHQRAGSADLVELHGSIHAVLCLDCGARFTRRLVQAQLENDNPSMAGAVALPAPDGDAHLEPACLADFRAPRCARCGGTLKPDVVFFGDGVAPACSAAAEQALARADALLVVGSSVMVFSSFRLCRMAAAAGRPVAAINLGMTRADHLLSFKTEAPAEQVLPALVQRLAPA